MQNGAPELKGPKRLKNLLKNHTQIIILVGKRWEILSSELLQSWECGELRYSLFGHWLGPGGYGKPTDVAPPKLRREAAASRING